MEAQTGVSEAATEMPKAEEAEVQPEEVEEEEKVLPEYPEQQNGHEEQDKVRWSCAKEAPINGQ